MDMVNMLTRQQPHREEKGHLKATRWSATNDEEILTLFCQKSFKDENENKKTFISKTSSFNKK